MKRFEYFQDMPGSGVAATKRKRPRKLSAYNKFAQYYMRQGYPMSEVSRLWREFKSQHRRPLFV